MFWGSRLRDLEVRGVRIDDGATAKLNTSGSL